MMRTVYLMAITLHCLPQITTSAADVEHNYMALWTLYGLILMVVSFDPLMVYSIYTEATSS